MLQFSNTLGFTDFSQLEQFEQMTNSETESFEFLLWAGKPNYVSGVTVLSQGLFTGSSNHWFSEASPQAGGLRGIWVIY